MNSGDKQLLTALFLAGVASVRGELAVRSWAETTDLSPPTHIFAAGKAATSMFAGLPKAWQDNLLTLLVTKTDHIGDAVFGRHVTAIEAGHPIPNRQSLLAGEQAIAFVEGCDENSRLLCLISGGASALVEDLVAQCDLHALIALSEAALGDGIDIGRINSRRKDVSTIKGGKLLSRFRGQSARTIAISDVQGDSIDVIGSGLGAAPTDRAFHYQAQIVASNAVARSAVADAAAGRGHTVIANAETLYTDVSDAADRIARQIIDGPQGIYIFGGEPTIKLPENPGKGGRNQALALELAKRVLGRRDISGLVAGTDGTDGPTDAAGAFFDGHTFQMRTAAEAALQQANSASFFAEGGDQLITGPTGTNVMDLVIAKKHG